jgi:hypothetical protein
MIELKIWLLVALIIAAFVIGALTAGFGAIKAINTIPAASP